MVACIIIICQFLHIFYILFLCMPSFTITKEERKHIGIRRTLEAMGGHRSQDSNANTAWASG